MDAARATLARENAALKAALADAQTKGLEVTAELAIARAKASEDMALIAQQTLRIAKLERQVYGQRSERSAEPQRSTNASVVSRLVWPVNELRVEPSERSIRRMVLSRQDAM